MALVKVIPLLSVLAVFTNGCDYGLKEAEKVNGDDFGMQISMSGNYSKEVFPSPRDFAVDDCISVQIVATKNQSNDASVSLTQAQTIQLSSDAEKQLGFYSDNTCTKSIKSAVLPVSHTSPSSTRFYMKSDTAGRINTRFISKSQRVNIPVEFFLLVRP